ncbi:MAG: YiiD C-terminal domain-containing protein [Ectothiorhodospiraceae bacterium]|nr:YiiD C-terminal domain-containing protein [Ectothiorhodospiraceae bacterium]MCH8502705.1 thioesterase domain-containing protein [Ectothiorhodospiraceae bacterium]
MPDLHELERYMLDRIPMARAMEVHLEQADESTLTLSAPLTPNVNHQGTVFGGSAAAIGVLSAWLMVVARLRAAGIPGNVVIQSHTMNYLKPIAGDFLAVAQAPAAPDWEKAVSLLGRKRPARLELQAQLLLGDIVVGTLEGRFVVQPEGIGAGRGG